MIRVDLSSCRTLQEFNETIRCQQEEAHGKGYCSIHMAIEQYIKHGNSYVEFGTNQGGTASTALLSKPSKMLLIDIDFSHYNEYAASIFQDYCKKNNIDLVTKQKSSLEMTLDMNFDILVIDSLHSYSHMQKELDLHSDKINKYIIAHDTEVISGKVNDSLFRCLQDFCNKTQKWKVIERNIVNVGYSVIGKVI